MSECHVTAVYYSRRDRLNYTIHCLAYVPQIQVGELVSVDDAMIQFYSSFRHAIVAGWKKRAEGLICPVCAKSE